MKLVSDEEGKKLLFNTISINFDHNITEERIIM